jgi:FKBP12-rapamycin complex-associated protein
MSHPLQLIARIQTPSPNIRNQVIALLTEVGRIHPQALIYPLTVASKSTSELRQATASEIMDRLRDHSAVLVEQVRFSNLPFPLISLAFVGTIG